MITVQVPTFDEFDKYAFKGYVKVKIKNKPDWRDYNNITKPLPGIPQGSYSDSNWDVLLHSGVMAVSSFYDSRQRTKWFRGYYISIIDYGTSAFDKIITKVNCKYGAPMGRPNKIRVPTGVKIFDRKVPLDSGGYDKGGAYWGIGSELRVRYTKDLSFIEFYRV